MKKISQSAKWLFFFSLLNIAVFLFSSYKFFTFIDYPQEIIAQIFIPLAFIGHYSSISLILFLFVIPFSLIGIRSTKTFAFILFSISTLVLIVDSVVFSLYRFHLNGMVWSLIVNGGITEILPLSLKTYLVFGAIIFVIVASELICLFLANILSHLNSTHKNQIAMLLLFTIASAHLLHVWADAVNYSPITTQTRILPAYLPVTAKRFMVKIGLAQQRNDPTIKAPNNNTALNYPTEPLVCPELDKYKNILFITLDGWRYDMLSKEITPNIFTLKEGSLYFANHSSAANTTRFGIFTLFYGIFGTYWHAMLAEEKGAVLVSHLNRLGYDFAVYGSARLNNPEFDRTVFSEIREKINLRASGETAPERDKDITKRFLNFLNSHDSNKPFLGFLFYDSAHAYDYPKDFNAPFKPAAETVEHLKLNKNKDPLPIKNRFLNAINFIDSEVGKVLNELETKSLMDNTIVIITADHGQEFNELGKNFWGHNGNFSRYQTFVPLVIHWKEMGVNQYKHLTSHLDIAPTLLDKIFACSTAYRADSNGKSLFDESSRSPLVIANWDRFAILSPYRIDVSYKAGYVDSYNEKYESIDTPIPNNLITTVIEGMQRFYDR